jgi:hypothetical protein
VDVTPTIDKKSYPDLNRGMANDTVSFVSKRTISYQLKLGFSFIYTLEV